MSGILYVVSTPIGNFQDITYRAESTLKEVDFIIAENRERAQKILNHIGTRKRIVTINTYTERKKAKEIASRIKNGESAALICASGTPCVSDPGFFVVSSCHENNLEVRVVPGASALTSAIAISGLHIDRFLFYGFLPQKKSKKKKVLKELESLPYPIVFFESPRRIRETLALIQEIFGLRKIAILKEMTKIHERAIRTDTHNVFEIIDNLELKGEFTIIVDRPNVT
ncbi:MAG: 16S rRNA (cytidine(1402)-2'-O)-methyltransferase [Deltaproteobacteria bacterium]|nr:16S rRNA (cytidine(1402)-2'-O)-methyltransferase [Deltaproteobacteria bacterium]